MSPETLLSDLEGVADVKLTILNCAGFIQVRDIRDIDDADVFIKIEAAVTQLCAGDPGGSEERWARQCELAKAVARRVKHADASPIHPPHLVCQLYRQECGEEPLFIDPVVTSTGQTYEKWYLRKWLQKAPTNPPQDPLTNCPLLPLNNSLDIDKFYVSNVAVKNAVEFYKRHNMRFNMLLKKR